MAETRMVSNADVATASVNGYNEKNWEKVQNSLVPDCVYDEIATNRKVHGVNDTIALWQGWARALPDSRATIRNQLIAGNTVVLELTWHGTHRGPLQTPRGEIPPTGKTIEIRACQVLEVSGERVKSIRHYFDMTTLLQQLGS